MTDPVNKKTAKNAGTSKRRKAHKPRRKSTRPVFKSKPVYYLPGTVYEVALNRIRYIFDEFDDIAVSTSGGKDSTVVLEMALMVARERNRLPLKVYWLDQECEYEATVAYQRRTANRPEIDFHWYQIPFSLFNATSHDHKWAHVWDENPEVEWVREKEPDSIHENTFGTTRFKDTLTAIADELVPGGAVLSGLRVEESPGRRAGLTGNRTYKWITWGNKGAASDTPGKGHYQFHPIFDLYWNDVWGAIHKNGWDYNIMYDHMYRHGQSPAHMRVSNYHHETAIKSLFFLQEIEPHTWEAATKRLPGLATAGQVGEADYYPKTLPFMFKSWREYRDYLLENLITDPDDREVFQRRFDNLDRSHWYVEQDRRDREAVNGLIANDVYGTKMTNFSLKHQISKANRIAMGLETPDHLKTEGENE